MIDVNTRRLMDKIDMLERANEMQRLTIETYRGRNVALTRENNAYAGQLGKMRTHAAQQAEKGQ